MTDYQLGNCIYCSVNEYEIEHIKFNLYSMVFEMKASHIGNIIYKCIAMKSDLKSSIYDTFDGMIKEEFENLQQHSKCKTNYFIHCYEILKNEIYLDKKVHEKIKEVGMFRVFGFTMEKMSSDLNKVFVDCKNKKQYLNEFQLFMYINNCIDILCYMQGNNISHRDIKLENIFLDNDGRIRLGDLGSSKKLNYINKKLSNEVRQYMNSVASMHTVVGTKTYMAPELFLAYEKGDSKTIYDPYKVDLFALGKTFLHLAILRKVDFSNLYTVGSEYYNKEVNRLLLEVKDPKMKECIKIMLTYDASKRPQLIQFRDVFFKKIFTDEIIRLNASNEQEIDVTVTAKINIPTLQSRTPTEEQNDLNQLKTLINDTIYNKEASNFDFKDIQPDLVTLDEGSNSSIFKKKGNKDLTNHIKSNKFYSTYLGEYQGNRVIITKFSFVSYPEIKKRFHYELNFFNNSVNTNSYPLLVKNYGTVSDSEYVYLISEYIDTPVELMKSIKIKKEVKEENTKYYSLDYIFTKFPKLEDFNSFFQKRNDNNYEANEKTNFHIRVKIFKQLIEAVKYLKEKGVCFADLSLKKVLIEKNTFLIKLRHYGLFQACFKHRYSSCSRLFSEENGFIFYPPEFFDGYIDEEKSDMWALGVCMYQIFSNGKNPWDAKTLGEYVIKVVFERNQGLKVVLGDKSKQFIEEIIKGLLTRVEDRKDINWVLQKLRDFS